MLQCVELADRKILYSMMKSTLSHFLERMKIGRLMTPCITVQSKMICGGRLQPYGTWTKITQEVTGKTTRFCRTRFTKKGQRTCWVDKYSTIIFNPDIECELPTTFFTVQPVPDYVRWMATGGEMHYLPLEKVQKLNTQIISDTPAAFLPSKILEMVYKVFSQGVENILRYISFLAWCTETDVTTFCQEYKEKLDKSFLNDKERE